MSQICIRRTKEVIGCIVRFINIELMLPVDARQRWKHSRTSARGEYNFRRFACHGLNRIIR